MHYTTVFDAAQAGYTTWTFPAFGMIFVVAGWLLVFRPDLMSRLMPGGLAGKARRFFGWVFFCFAVVWTLISFVATFVEYSFASGALRTGRYRVAEGPVTHFVPMPASGHSMESFVVGGRKFSYSDFVLTSGFNQTASHGGPIREGLPVRISYSGNSILRLEIGAPPFPDTPETAAPNP